jgi:signal transduction histidine kinase
MSDATSNRAELGITDPRGMRAATVLPSWMGSIRFRLTLVYSSVLFSIATFLVGVIYLAERAALAGSGDDVSVHGTIQWPSGQIGNFEAITPQEFANRVNGRALDVLRHYSLIAILVLFLISLVVGWIVSGSVLKPIERITDVAKDIQATDLSRRINLGGPPDELRELADTFDDMLGRIDDAFESQRQFIHETSHELRNPLAVIRTNLDVTLSDPDASEEDLRHTLEVVQRSSERMTKLVDDLLVYARNGSLSVEHTRVDISQLVTEIADEFHAPAQAKGVSVIGEPAPGLWVDGDRHALRQALANLLANAERVAPPGSTIRVRAGAQAPWVWMSVEDEGPGIAPEDQDRVFQRFWRGEAAGRSEVRSGLGLTIVRQIAQAHGGAVKLASEVGRGAAFALWLPAARDPEAAAASAPPARAADQDPTMDPATPPR